MCLLAGVICVLWTELRRSPRRRRFVHLHAALNVWNASVMAVSHAVIIDDAINNDCHQHPDLKGVQSGVFEHKGDK